MKGESFITKSNLELENLNFILKENNILYVKDLYTLKDGTAMVKLRFDSIKGIYNVPQENFETLLSTNIIDAVPNRKFADGDTVTHTIEGKGKVKSAWYDSTMNFWLYQVVFDRKPGIKILIHEDDLV